MATFSKQKLSSSTSGRGIKVVATATAGTAIHTAIAGASDWDEVYLYAVNAHTGAVILTVEWGGVTDPDDLIEFTIPHSSGLYVVAPGLLLQGGLGRDVFKVRALTQEVYNILSQYDDQIQTIVDAGSIDTIPADVKSTLNQSWQVIKDARADIEGNAGIMEMLTWGT